MSKKHTNRPTEFKKEYLASGSLFLDGAEPVDREEFYRRKGFLQRKSVFQELTGYTDGILAPNSKYIFKESVIKSHPDLRALDFRTRKRNRMSGKDLD